MMAHNNIVQRTALRAAADAERYPASSLFVVGGPLGACSTQPVVVPVGGRTSTSAYGQHFWGRSPGKQALQSTQSLRAFSGVFDTR